MPKLQALHFPLLVKFFWTKICTTYRGLKILQLCVWKSENCLKQTFEGDEQGTISANNLSVYSVNDTIFAFKLSPDSTGDTLQAIVMRQLLEAIDVQQSYSQIRSAIFWM